MLCHRIFTDSPVALVGDFEYFLDRIGCNETLSDNFFISEAAYKEFQRSRRGLLEARRSGMLNFDQVVEMCTAFVNTLGSPRCPPNPGLLASKILQFHQENFVNIMQVDTDTHEVVHPTISDRWNTAWETKFEDKGLENFEVYLQNLWIERRKRWRRYHPPTYSLCATIVQSSCAGKSRLVYSYNIRLSQY